MKLGRVQSRALSGVEAVPVCVEVHLHGGLPAFSIVGLPEAAVRESRDRVRAAIVNAGFDFPDKRIIANLAPADLPKQGSRFDLAIALALLLADDQIPVFHASRFEFIGELSLGSELRSVGGALPAALAISKTSRGLIVAEDDSVEASLCESCRVFPAKNLQQVVERLRTGKGLTSVKSAAIALPAPTFKDMSEVKGQLLARRALEVAASGGHNLLMVGPPGTGKSMLASRLPGILPQMSVEEAIETAAVASISTGGFDLEKWRTRPFRAPHHTASGVALVGGGSYPKPGEISLAHNGVLFLDELPEYTRTVLDVLRQPLETGCVTISRAGRSSEFPAQFQLVAAMNPCPCGHDGDPDVECRCTPDQVSRYQSRVSGPMLDRIDMHVGVPRVDITELMDSSPGESSAAVRTRVEASHQLQIARQGCSNARLPPSGIESHCVLAPAENDLLRQSARKLNLSMRAHHRLLRVARSIADLDVSYSISANHLLEAISYRQLA